MEGRGQFIWKDRVHRYLGHYKNGLKHGPGKYYTKTDEYFEGSWENGKKQGKFYYKAEMGEKIQILYEDVFH